MWVGWVHYNFISLTAHAPAHCLWQESGILGALKHGLRVDIHPTSIEVSS